MPDELSIILRLQAQDLASPTIARVAGEMRAMEAASTSTSGGAAVLSTRTAEFEGQASKAAVSSGKLATSLGQVGQAAASSGGQLGGISSIMGSMRGNFVLAGAAAALFAVKANVAYEDVLNHVQAFAGATDAEITRYRALIDKMSVEFGLSATDLANSLYSLASAGIHGRDAMIALQVAGKAAAASNTDVAITTDALTTAIKAYGLTGQQIIQAQNDMAQAVKLGKLEYSDLASNIGSVIPVAAHLGVTLKDLGDMTVLTTNIGNSAAETFDMERNLLIALDAPAKQQVKTLQALGLSVEDVSVKHRGLTAVLKTVNDALTQQVPSIAEIAQRTDLSAKASANLKAQMVEQDQVARRLFGGNMVAMREFFSIYNDGGKSWHATSVQMQHDSSSVNDSWNIASKAPGKHLQEAEQEGMLAARTLGGLLTPALVRVADDFVILGGAVQKATPLVADFFKEFHVVDGIKTEMNALAGPVIALDSLLNTEASSQHRAAEATREHTEALIGQKNALGALASTDLGSQSFPGSKLAAPPPAPKSPADLVKAMNDLGKHLQDLLDQANAKRLFDERAGAPASVLAADSASVKLAEKNLADFNAATSTSTKAHQKHVKVIDDLTTDLEKIRGRLTKALNDAVAQLVLDERKKGTPAATIAADQTRVDSAKKSLDDFTKQVNDATAAVKESKGLPLQKQDQSQAQANYDAALKQAAKDIHDHGSMTVLDKERLLDSKNALDGFTDSTKKAAAWVDRQTKTPLNALQQQDKDRADKQLAFDKAVADGAADLRAGHPITIAHQQAIDKDKASLDRFDKSISDAQHSADKATAATQKLVDVLQQIPSAWQNAVNNLARLIVTGQSGQQGRFGGQPGVEPGTMPTRGDYAGMDISKAATKQEGLNLANEQAQRIASDAMLTAARSAGDLARAFDLISQTDGANLDSAWKSLREHFLTGDGDLGSLVASWKAAKAASDKLTSAEIDAANATGQYATAVSARQKQASDSQADAVGLLTEKYHDHVGVTQADIDAGVAARQATEAWTQSQWDANYATASLAQQQNMLSQRFSGMVSQAQQQQGGIDRIASAQLTVLADQGALEIDKLKEMVTAEDDQTAVMQAASAVAKAAGEGRVAAINDQTAILQSQEAVWTDMQNIAHATSPQTLAVAQAQLVVDRLAVQENRDKAAADRANSAAQVRVASDGVTLAKDKAAADKQMADSQYKLDQDRLKTAVDTEKLTEDTVKLDGMMAQSLDIMASALTGVNSRQDEINSVLNSIASDNSAIRADNAQTQTDQLTADRQQQALQMQIASDNRLLSLDQQASDATSLAGQTRIAQDGYSLEQARFSLQQAQYTAQQQTNTLLGMSLSEMQQWFSPMLDAMRNLRSGVGHNWVGSGPDPFEQFINSAPSAFASNPTP